MEHLLRCLLLPFLENVLDYRQSRERTGPTGIERDVGEDLGGLLLRETVIHRAAQVIGDLCRLVVGDQGAYGDKAAVSRGQRSPEPEVAEQEDRRVFYKPRRDDSKVAAD